MSDLDDQIGAEAQRRIGTLLCGKYRIERILGVGGMATVYAAIHRNGHHVAVKLLHPEFSARKDIRARFIREGLAANTVNHPGAVAVIDDDVTSDGAAFLVMERLEGKTLEQLWEERGRRLPTRMVLAIGRELCGVLAAAHRAGIVHRDIKPENLFLTDDGQLKILDFGLAQLRDAARPKDTHTGMIFGTPAFMPPEQANGQTSLIDERTDLWAVGATMFTLVSGKMVHEGETAQHFVMLSATKPARSLATVLPHAHPALVELIDRALSWERETRWSNADAMLAAIRETSRLLTGDAEPKLPTSGKITPAGAGATVTQPLASPDVLASDEITKREQNTAAEPPEANADESTRVDETILQRVLGLEGTDSSSPPTERNKKVVTPSASDDAPTTVRGPVSKSDNELTEPAMPPPPAGWSDLRNAIEDTATTLPRTKTVDAPQAYREIPQTQTVTVERTPAMVPRAQENTRATAPARSIEFAAILPVSARRGGVEAAARARAAHAYIPLLIGVGALGLTGLAIIVVHNRDSRDHVTSESALPAPAPLLTSSPARTGASVFAVSDAVDAGQSTRAMPAPQTTAVNSSRIGPSVSTRSTASASSTTPRTSTRCSQPYDLDDGGIKHWKSDCL